MQLKLQAPGSLKTALIFAALLTHGLFSSPAPADPGLAEGLIALCLLIAALPQLPSLLDGGALINEPGRMAWLWLLIVPLGIGLWQGHDLRDLSRDLIAIGFLGLPVLIGAVPSRSIRPLAWMMATTGALLALRYWYITGAGIHGGFGLLKSGDGLLYLCLDPTMLFAAIYLPIMLMETTGWRMRDIALRAVCLIGAFLCWGTLGGMQMRGALGLAFAVLAFYGAMKIRTPLIPLIMVSIALIISVLFWNDVSKIFLKLLEKQRLVGFNARDDDFAAIWKIVAVDLGLFLFGSGWGAIYSSPAVGGYWVNYSHSAIGFFLLKTGLIGISALGVYLLSFLEGLSQAWRQNRNILLAIVPPLLLSFTVYTSYKFLTCGILLLLLQNLNAHSHSEPG